MTFFKFLAVAIISYVAAAPLSSNISMNLNETNWFSLWTYIIWLCSLGIWAAITFAVVLFFVSWMEWVSS